MTDHDSSTHDSERQDESSIFTPEFLDMVDARLDTRRIHIDWDELARVATGYHLGLGALMEHAMPTDYDDDRLVLTIDVNREALCRIFESRVEAFKSAFMDFYSVPIAVKFTVYREEYTSTDMNDVLFAQVIPEPEKDPEAMEAWFAQERQSLSLLQSPAEIDFWLAASSHINGLEPQVEVGRYRVDFAVRAQKIAIEIDGHDYHSSKEQREADAIRERNLQKMGWRVIRFTGTEVYRDARGCAGEAVYIIKVMGGEE